MAWRKTACILCENNCGIEVELGGADGRRFVRTRGDRDHPSSAGYACEKPHRLDYYQSFPERLTTPLRRNAAGELEPTDWDSALSEIASRLAGIRDTHGGESIFYYGGGGQGNHLPGAYATATRRVLGSRFRSSALAQEKTGEFWVAHRMMGNATRADFEHCQVGLFIGKNPWQSHGISRARVVLKEMAKDPERTLIVIDPRRSETAAMADVHLAPRPGTDLWLLAALARALVDLDLLDRRFLAERSEGAEEVEVVLRELDFEACCEACGVGPAEVERVARILGEAESLATFEDLGVQMNRHSTLVSYVHRFLWMLTGNFGKPGCAYVPSAVVKMFGGHESSRPSPVLGARVIGGMVPCNVIAEEILADHPRRYRAMIVEAANPAHSLADSPAFREAMAALELSVVIDVALTETARCADFVLPAATQFEKAEATFFNFEFPDNCFHLRRALLEPPAGVLPEAEIHCRLVEALGGVDAELLEGLKSAAQQGLAAFAEAFAPVMMDPKQAALAPVWLYRALGPTLPAGLEEGAVLWGLMARLAMTEPASVARAGFEGAPLEACNALFERLLESPSGMVFSRDVWDTAIERVERPGHRIQLALPDLLEDLKASLREAPPAPDPAFPFVLSAGERRSFTANTIIRDPNWRKKDGQGALRMNPGDAERLGIASGDRVELRTARGRTEVTVEIGGGLASGHVSLPNGAGIGASDERGGVCTNELTQAADRDAYVGTPWHKAVPASIRRLD